MKIMKFGGYRVGISEARELAEKRLAQDPIDLSKYRQDGPRLVTKAAEKKRIIPPPYSMAKLLDLLDVDEYHWGCVKAVEQVVVSQVKTTNANVKAWFDSAEFSACEDQVTALGEIVRYYQACGNGFLLKMRNSLGEWRGLETILPSEIMIADKQDQYGFSRPDYVQLRGGKRKDYAYADIIHLRQPTHRSKLWGLACLPIAINIEILAEIKTFDYNNFKNGLMIDYFIIVEGGTLRDGIVTDDEGNTVIQDVYSEIEKALAEVKGNNRSHSTILIESDSPNVKIRIEPLQQYHREGGFLTLKKDLREGIFAYHRVPPRLVSQLVPGQLGGDNSSDMTMFYEFVVKPIQNRLALALANEFNWEFGWNVRPDEFQFGDLTEKLMTQEERLFAQSRKSIRVKE